MGRYSEAAAQASELTNKQLSTEIAAMSPFNRDMLNRLLPLKRDKEAFLKLMIEVENETTRDEKLAYIKNNITSAGGVVLKLLKVFL